MKQQIAAFLYKALGWRYKIETPDVSKCVICVAPHTSTWDFFIGKLFYTAMGKDAKFLIKSFYWKYPFKPVCKALGGIPVYRDRAHGLVGQVVDRFNSTDKLQLAVTPEGTRKKNTQWKSGFYRIAKQAQVPIVIATLDYKNKYICFKAMLTPSGDEAKDIAYIQSFYSPDMAKYPQQFATGL